MSLIAKPKPTFKRLSAPSFSAPRLARPWVDVDPTEVPPTLAQALRDRSARLALHIPLSRRHPSMIEVLA